MFSMSGWGLGSGHNTKASWDLKAIMWGISTVMAHFAVDVYTCIYTGKNASSFRWDWYLQQCGGQAASNSALPNRKPKGHIRAPEGTVPFSTGLVRTLEQG